VRLRGGALRVLTSVRYSSSSHSSSGSGTVVVHLRVDSFEASPANVLTSAFLSLPLPCCFTPTPHPCCFRS
jgi:hypothetical protein